MGGVVGTGGTEGQGNETVREKYPDVNMMTAAEFQTYFTWVVRISQQNISYNVIVHAHGNQIIGVPGYL